jgi:hypothetical protein
VSEVGRVVEIGESKAQIFELRVVNAVWATLKVSRAGLVLEHHLNPVRIATCPGLMIYDGDGEPLSLRQGGQLLVSHPDGRVRLKLSVDDEGTLVDVVDPQGCARLAVELRGPGSIGNSLIQEGCLILTLKSV